MVTDTMTNRRTLVLNGTTYYANREAPVRDGGSPGVSRHPWYASVEDNGSCIDDRVPEGYFRSMKECHRAITEHHQERL